MVLDNPDYITQIDASEMRGILQQFPEQCNQAVAIGKGINVPSSMMAKKIDKVLVCGLGGSAIGGDILRTLFSHRKIVITVNRDYHLPSFVDEKTLIFTVSYSGNTEETISAFKQAAGKGYPTICVTSGGQLQALSEKNDMLLIKIPPGMPPRCAIGFLSIPVIVVLEEILGAHFCNYRELVQIISDLAQRYLPEKKTSNNPAKLIALELKGKIPLIYGVTGITEVVAHRLKTQFNEN